MLFLHFLFKRTVTILPLALITGLLYAKVNNDAATSLKYSRKDAGIAIEIFTNAVIAADSAIQIPFSRAGNLVLVQARADSIEGNFVLDTGCPNLVLNLTYFRHYPLSFDQDADKNGMTGSVGAVSQTMIRSFSFGNMHYPRLEADLVNLGHIENMKGVKILGLLGVQLFKQFELFIDYEKNLIWLRMVNRKENGLMQHPMLSDTSAYHTVPFDLLDDKIILKTEMGGKKIKLIIDSGAETNIIDSRLPDKIFEQVNITGRILVAGVGNKRVEALQGDMRNIKIGNQLILSLPIVITNMEKTCFSYSGCVDGILGFDFLSLQKIGFNFVKRKMYIWK